METREQQVRTWSMLCHLSALAGLFIPFGNILGPLIVWQIKKNELPEIELHGKESVNFQITMSIVTLIFSAFTVGALGYDAFTGSPFGMFVDGFGMGFILAMIRLVGWVLVVFAAIRANRGEFFRYPSIRFVK